MFLIKFLLKKHYLTESQICFAEPTWENTELNIAKIFFEVPYYSCEYLQKQK